MLAQLIDPGVTDRVPRQPGEAGRTRLDCLADRGHVDGVGVAECQRLGEERGLDLIEQLGHPAGHLTAGHRGLLAGVAPHHHGHALIEVARPHLDAHRHTLQLPSGCPPTEAGVGVVVDLAADARTDQVAGQVAGGVAHPTGVVLAHHHHHHLGSGHLGRHPQAGVVAVRHDQPAHHAGRHAPGGGPRHRVGAVGALEGDVERLGKVLAQLVAGAHLQRLAVAHHRLDREGIGRPGEALLGDLATAEHRDGQVLLHEVGVHLVKDAHRVAVGLLLRGVSGVALLPQELAGAQEDAGPLLPADHVAPLVEQHRQVAVALDPLGHELAEDRLGRGPHHHRVLQLVTPGVGDDRQLGTETLDVVGLAGEVFLGDEQREVGVLGTGGLEAAIHLGLHVLPDRIGVGADYHRASHRTVLGQLGPTDDVLVPAGEIVGLGGEYTLGSHASIVGAAVGPEPIRQNGERRGATLVDDRAEGVFVSEFDSADRSAGMAAVVAAIAL